MGTMLLMEECALVHRDALLGARLAGEEPRPFVPGSAHGLEADDVLVELRRAGNVAHDQDELGDPGRKATHLTTTSPTASSIASRMAWSSAIPDAAAFSSTCSGRDAPIIAEATFSFRSTQASASWAIVMPSPS